MNSPTSGYDHEKLGELASAVFDGVASESQLEQLTVMLSDNPSAQEEYLKLADMHALLAVELVAAPSELQVKSFGEESSVRCPSLSRGRYVAVGITVLAASLLLAFFLGRSNTNDTNSDLASELSVFAHIAQETGAVWHSELIAVGDRIGRSQLQLASGIVRIEFDSGVEVTLQGPAEFELLSVSETKLVAGLLTATVPPGAEGFVVDTPSAAITDLGTSFGIDIDENGGSSVSVFDGEVEIAPSDTGDKRLLTEGQSIRIGADFKIESVDLDSQRFERLWPTASGIAGSTESVQIVPPWPKQIRFVQSDNRIFVRAEGPEVRLRSELDLNISQPGTCEEVSDLSPQVLEPNQAIRSYILHFSPQTQRGPRRAKRISGSIRFARPVLGIIVKHEELAASSRRFGRRGAGESNDRRELNLTGDQTGDRISLSEDRRTVTLDLVAPGRSSDLVRVIVEGRETNRGLRGNRR